MTHATLNNALFTLSLLLQLALLVTLFRKRIVRTYPVFTALIAFYLLRAILLFSIFGHLSPEAYDALYANLSLLDILLQLATVIELVVHIIRSQSRSLLLRLTPALIAVIIATIATAVVVSRLPARTAIPIDRSQLFLSFLLLLVFLWAALTPSPSLLRRLTEGFALNALLTLCAIAGHVLAASHRDARSYTLWSYVAATAWLLTVTLWLFTLRTPRNMTST